MRESGWRMCAGRSPCQGHQRWRDEKPAAASAVLEGAGEWPCGSRWWSVRLEICHFIGGVATDEHLEPGGGSAGR